MIITKEMICAVDACASSMPDLDAYIALYGEDKDFKEIKRIILRDHPEWAYLVQWLMTKVPAFIQMGEHSFVSEYRVLHVSGEFSYHTSIEDAITAKKEEILNQTTHIIDQAIIVHEEKHDNEDITWHIVDVLNCPDDGNFQVFNPLTGSHEKVIGKENAVNKQKEIKNAIISGYVISIEQKITNPLGDVAWVSV